MSFNVIKTRVRRLKNPEPTEQLISIYLTFFNRGLDFLALEDAPRLLDANSAEAVSMLTPCFLAIPEATFLNPGCDLHLAIINTP
jgi:hypothetical protein